MFRFALAAVMMTIASNALASQQSEPLPGAQEWYIARLSNTTLVGRREAMTQLEPTWVIDGMRTDGDPSCVSAEGNLDIVWINGDGRSLSFMTIADENARSTYTSTIPLPMPGWRFVGQPAVSHVAPGRTEVIVEIIVDDRCDSKLLHGVKMGHASDPTPVTWTEWSSLKESTASPTIQRMPPSLASMNPRSFALCTGPKLGPQREHAAAPTTILFCIGGAMIVLLATIIITTRQRLRDLAAMAAFLGG